MNSKFFAKLLLTTFAVASVSTSSMAYDGLHADWMEGRSLECSNPIMDQAFKYRMQVLEQLQNEISLAKKSLNIVKLNLEKLKKSERTRVQANNIIRTNSDLRELINEVNRNSNYHMSVSTSRRVRSAYMDATYETYGNLFDKKEDDNNAMACVSVRVKTITLEGLGNVRANNLRACVNLSLDEKDSDRELYVNHHEINNDLTSYNGLPYDDFIEEVVVPTVPECQVKSAIATEETQEANTKTSTADK